MNDGYYRYNNTTLKIRELEDNLKLYESAKPPQKYGDEGRVWAVFRNKKLVYDAVNRLEKLVPIRGAPGNFTHGAMYKVDPRDAGWQVGYWRKPNEADYKRNEVELDG